METKYTVVKRNIYTHKEKVVKVGLTRADAAHAVRQGNLGGMLAADNWVYFARKEE